MEPYRNRGPVNTDVDFDTGHVKGKTAIVTGGANGIGEGYVRALVKAGAFVVIGDLDQEAGSKLASELSPSVKFVKCDVTLWTDQLAVFKEAIASSPAHRVDIVVANAGISGADAIYFNNVELEEPEEPKLDVLNINLIGALYTVKLALHYFRRQNALNKGAPQDALLVLQGSLAGYIDLPGALQYGGSKYGLRAVMRNLRRTEWQHNIRVNYIGPWFIATKIMSPTVLQMLADAGTEFATVEDAGAALLRLASDTSINGRAFAIVPRSQHPRGYMDIDYDDYPDGSVLKLWQDLSTGAVHRTQVAPNRQ